MPLGVVDSSRSKVCWVFDQPVSNTVSSGALLLDCFMISGKKNDRVMYRLRLLFEMEKVKKLTEEE